ncbi:protease complex subunit PrcB family protein [Nevskia sp.]|uniref:protease complex subunit PrcB family protein n=1 Tax=Nevskia sp. TaxID=1929292 RepID=UPI0025F3A123|nr:protease complex subunit PrcB family protein [Nevskia sp.]
MSPGFASRFHHLAAPLAAVAAVLMAGCASLPIPGLDRLPGADDNVEVSEIRRLVSCGGSGDAAVVTLLADEAALSSWQSARGIDLIAAAPGGALPSGPFAVVEHGARATGGYGLLISRRAYQQGHDLRLTTSFLSPKTGEVRSDGPTSPCVLVKLPLGNYDRVSVIDPSGKRRARYLPPVPGAPAVAVPAAAAPVAAPSAPPAVAEPAPAAPAELAPAAAAPIEPAPAEPVPAP